MGEWRRGGMDVCREWRQLTDETRAEMQSWPDCEMTFTVT